MLCDVCNQRPATVHITTKLEAKAQAPKWDAPLKQHFCEPCADKYFAEMPGMNASRRLICLSDAYRNRLYDLLEETHPEVFDNKDAETCRRGSQLMREFLRKNFEKDKLEITGDAFEMLCHDFI